MIKSIIRKKSQYIPIKHINNISILSLNLLTNQFSCHTEKHAQNQTFKRDETLHCEAAFCIMK